MVWDMEWLVDHFAHIRPLGDWFFLQGHEPRYRLLAPCDEDFQTVFHLRKISGEMGFRFVDGDGHALTLKTRKELVKLVHPQCVFNIRVGAVFEDAVAFDEFANAVVEAVGGFPASGKNALVRDDVIALVRILADRC